ncbi:hypothetical protein AMJ80_08810 [bacterium SM23_31]|nr:MAG: hypothetical protein AMJ80_08810 [bacterium SM23_31]
MRHSHKFGKIISALQEYAKKIIPFEESDIYLIDRNTGKISSVSKRTGQKMKQKISGFLEEGIIDWIIEEKRAVVIEDFETISGESRQGQERNFVIIPLIFRGKEYAVFVLYTSKPKQEFTNQELELLTLLAGENAIPSTRGKLSH